MSWSERRVLVTGATGMVGSWLARRLLDEGATVVALVIDDDPRSELLRSGTIELCSVVSGRLEDYTTVERAVKGHEVDTVIHLGAQTIVGLAHRDPKATFETNVAGTWNVLEACRGRSDPVRSVVVASSDKAYGDKPKPELPYTEPMSLDARHPYELSKAMTDLLAQSYARTYGLPVTIARCGNIYGGGDLNWSRIVPGTIRSLLQREQPIIRSDGTFLRDYVHVDDVVEAYLALAARAADDTVAGEAFNFSDETPRSVMDMYSAVCKAVGSGQVEPRIEDTAVGEIKDQYLDANKAREVLGWRPAVNLEDGLVRTVDWYKEVLSSENLSDGV